VGGWSGAEFVGARSSTGAAAGQHLAGNSPPEPARTANETHLSGGVSPPTALACSTASAMSGNGRRWYQGPRRRTRAATPPNEAKRACTTQSAGWQAVRPASDFHSSTWACGKVGEGWLLGLCAAATAAAYRPDGAPCPGTDTSTCHMGFRCIVRRADPREQACSRVDPTLAGGLCACWLEGLSGDMCGVGDRTLVVTSTRPCAWRPARAIASRRPLQCLSPR